MMPGSACMLCIAASLMQRSRLITLSVFPNSDESEKKQYLYPYSDPDCHQNLITSSLAHCQPFLKILCKSVLKFLRKVANRQTDRQTDKQTKNDENITFFRR